MTDTPKHASPVDSIRSTVARASDEVAALTRSESNIRHNIASALQLTGATHSWDSLTRSVAGLRENLRLLEVYVEVHRQNLTRAIGAGPGCNWEALVRRAHELYEEHRAHSSVKASSRLEAFEEGKELGRHASKAELSLELSQELSAKLGEALGGVHKNPAGSTLGEKLDAVRKHAEMWFDVSASRLVTVEALRVALGAPNSDWGASELIARVRSQADHIAVLARGLGYHPNTDLGELVALVVELKRRAEDRSEQNDKWLRRIWAALSGKFEGHTDRTNAELVGILDALLGVCSSAAEFETITSRRNLADVSGEEFEAFRALTRALNAPALSYLAKNRRTSSSVLQETAGEPIAKPNPFRSVTSGDK